MTAMKAVTFVGARREAYLPAWIPVSIRIINHERFRSYSPFTHQTKSTYHDTGNPRTNAEGEYSWAAAGRPGGVVGGYTHIFDDTKIIQTGPLNERSWHAGTPRGNESFGCEHAFGGAVSWTRSLEIGMALHGALIEMQGLDPDDAAVLHQFWTGKWCSGQILNRGIWPAVKAGIKRYAALAAAARAGKAVAVPAPDAGAGEAPTAAFAAPVMPRYPDGTAWDGREDMVENGVKFEAQRLTATTTVNLRRRQWASTESLDTGPVIPAGTEVALLGWVAGELVDGISEWWIGDSGSRLWAGGFDVAPKADPEYGKAPEKAPGMRVVNGRMYYPLVDELTGDPGRTITIKRPGNLRRWADVDSPVTGEVAPGQDVVCGWWTRGSTVGLTMPDGLIVDESIWYVVGLDLDGGNRFWAGLTEERPD